MLTKKATKNSLSHLTIKVLFDKSQAILAWDFFCISCFFIFRSVTLFVNKNWSAMRIESYPVPTYPMTSFYEACKADLLFRKIREIICRCFHWLTCGLCITKISSDKKYAVSPTRTYSSSSSEISSDKKLAIKESFLNSEINEEENIDPDICFEKELLEGCWKGDIARVEKAIKSILECDFEYFTTQYTHIPLHLMPSNRAVAAALISDADNSACKELLDMLIPLNKDLVKKVENYLFDVTLSVKKYQFFFDYLIMQYGFNINCERGKTPCKQIIFTAIDCAMAEKNLEKIQFISGCPGVDFTKKHGRISPKEYVEELLEKNQDDVEMKQILEEIQKIVM